MYEIYRRLMKKVILPALDALVGLLPRSVRVALLVGAADSLGLRQVRFDAPLRIAGGDGGATTVNLELFPGDRSVIPSVIIGGEWELSEPEFVVAHLKPGTRYTMLDIGANFGLFTLQVMKLLEHKGNVQAIRDVHLFEPDPFVAPVLRRNMNAAEGRGISFNVIERAVGAEPGRATFYLDNSNKANNSLAPRAMDRAVSGVTRVEVDVMGAAELARLAGEESDTRIIYKSDLQGIDPTIVAALPPAFWDCVDVMIVELWPQVLRDYEFFSDHFAAACGRFDVVILEEFGKTRQIKADELPMIISNSKDHQYYNLLCHRV
jgi:FkbM family methyltransferase